MGGLSTSTTYPNTTLLSESRPRAHYCWLHGWNNTHSGATCNVVGQNPAYTVQMRNATGPDGTGGNPRVGVPVRLNFLLLSLVSVRLVSHHHHNLLTLPPPPPRQAIKDSPCAPPNDAVRAGAPTKQIAPSMLQAEGHNPTASRVRDVASLKPTPNPHPSLRIHPHPNPTPKYISTTLALPPKHIAASYPHPSSRSQSSLKHNPRSKTTTPPFISRSLSWSLPLVTLSIPLHPLPLLPDSQPQPNSSLCAY